MVYVKLFSVLEFFKISCIVLYYSCVVGLLIYPKTPEDALQLDQIAVEKTFICKYLKIFIYARGNK